MNRMNYNFKDKSLLQLALTHSSFANENKLPGMLSNERLEFLGDAVLDAVISEKIYCDYPELSEGELTKVRAGLVCEPMLAKKSQMLRLSDMLRMGRGELNSGGNKRASILCDLFEAVVGAIFIDGGYDAARDFVLEAFREDVDSILGNYRMLDAKTFLQEELQRNSSESVDYRLLRSEGPDHNKRFFIEAYHLNEKIGSGSGRTKKEAEQAAAYNAIENLGFK